jgi:hypothetical protein
MRRWACSIIAPIRGFNTRQVLRTCRPAGMWEGNASALQHLQLAIWMNEAKLLLFPPLRYFFSRPAHYRSLSSLYLSHFLFLTTSTVAWMEAA